VLALSIIQDGAEPDRNGPRRLEVVKTDLCRYPKAFKEPTQTEACAAWLVEVLEEAGEPMRPREVVALGKGAGFKEGVIYRARKELEGTVVNTEGKRAPGNRWEYVG